MTPAPRHHWVRVAPDAALHGVAGDAAAAVRDWIARGLPLVARARQPGDAPDEQPLGLALVAPKRRIGLTVAASAVRGVEPPPALQSVLPVLPDAWQPAARELVRRADATGTRIAVYGSAVWQAWSGERRLDASSDLDLLLPWPDDAALPAVLALLHEVGRIAPMRLDGEFVASDGRAVAWRELAGTQPEVLVKGTAGARLVPRSALRAVAA